MAAMSCRRFLVVSVTAMSLAACRPGSVRGEQVIRLGGVRNVTATVSESDRDYRIAVEMLPVRAFDQATNKALNLSKGRMYAVQALGKHLRAGSLTSGGWRSGRAASAAVLPPGGGRAARRRVVREQALRVPASGTGW